MTGDPVPDTDHILRYIDKKHIDRTEDGAPVITGGGFIARPRDENKPSYNWIESLAGTLEEKIQQIRAAARLRYHANDRLVRLNVGAIRQYVARETDDHRAITVIHDPLEPENSFPADPSHSFMTNVPDENDPEGERVGDLIRDCLLDVFPARV